MRDGLFKAWSEAVIRGAIEEIATLRMEAKRHIAMHRVSPPPWFRNGVCWCESCGDLAALEFHRSRLGEVSAAWSRREYEQRPDVRERKRWLRNRIKPARIGQIAELLLQQKETKR